MSKDDGSVWQMEDLMKALKKSLRFAYSARRKNGRKPIPYDGPDLTSCRLLACAPNVKHSLTASTLQYHKERGRNAMDVILMCAVRLGIEQGLRMMNDSTVGDEETRKMRSEEEEDMYAQRRSLRKEVRELYEKVKELESR